MLGKYGETLVVDWGLAKAADRPESNGQNEPPLRLLSGGGSTSTQMGQCLGTPAYMSPEQASGRLDLMAATSDVYSLGATLYAILTGKTSIKQGSVEEVLRQVRTGDFEKPRSRDLRISPALESVCLKAMALKPDDRYATAADFAGDLERWLSDEPVTACVDPIPKRIARWSRRHRVLFSSLVAGSLASILILSVSLVLLLAANRRERASRDTADSERVRAESNLAVAKQAVSTMLTEVGREELAQFPQMEQTREKLLTKARDFYDEFLTQRPTDETLRFESAVAMRNLAEIDRLVDHHEEAEDRYSRSITELQDLAAINPANAMYRRQLASVLDDIGQLVKRRDASRAEDFFDEAIELQQALTASDSNPELLQEMARSFYNRGLVRAEQGNRDAAREDVNAAIDTLQNILENSASPDPSVTQEIARCYNNLANISKAMGDRATSRTRFSTAIALLDEQVERYPRNRDLIKELAIYQNNFANLLRSEGELELADQTSSQAIEKLSSLAQPLPVLANELANAHHSRGVILSQRQLSKEADVEYERASSILKRLTMEFPGVSLYHDRLGNAYFQLGTMQFQSGTPSEAVPLILEAMSEHQVALKQSPNEPNYRQHLKNDFVGLILIYLAQKDHESALESSLNFADAFPDDGAAQFDAAQLTARCIALVVNEKSPFSDSHRVDPNSSLVSHVIDLLQTAKEAGFQDNDKVALSVQRKGAFFLLRDNLEVVEVLKQMRVNGPIGKTP
jgi:serine/threonine-protein kinase